MEENKMKKGTVAVLSIMVGAIAGMAAAGSVVGKSLNKNGNKVDKFKSYYYMLNQWFQFKQNGESIEKYFIEKGYSKIAIYGMGEMGKCLYAELKDTDVSIKYAIDKNFAGEIKDLLVLDIDDELEEVDAVIVTATFAFDTIKEDLAGRINCPIISLEDIIYDI